MIRLVVVLAAVAGPALAQQIRVEPRALVKERQIFVGAGGVWLERGDLYVSPGMSLSATWYPSERDGIEVRAIWFFSRLNSAAQELRDSTGLLPETQRPVALVQGGWRRSLSYGKLAFAGSIVHFDLQAGAHAGFLPTDRALTPALSGFGGVVARAGDRMFVQIDLNVIGSLESRAGSSVVIGVLPAVCGGFRL
jgi:hypothetical protein